MLDRLARKDRPYSLPTRLYPPELRVRSPSRLSVQSLALIVSSRPGGLAEVSMEPYRTLSVLRAGGGRSEGGREEPWYAELVLRQRCVPSCLTAVASYLCLPRAGHTAPEARLLLLLLSLLCLLRWRCHIMLVKSLGSGSSLCVPPRRVT